MYANPVFTSAMLEVMYAKPTIHEDGVCAALGCSNVRYNVHVAPAPITAGVPQGSILGQTPFLLYVSDLDQCLSPETRLSLFADDTTLYRPHLHAGQYE